MEKRLLSALSLTHRNLAVSKNESQRQGNGRCSWVCYIKTARRLRVYASAVCVYYISAWASALLVSTFRAMPEPLCVGRVTDTDSHAFLFYIPIKRLWWGIGHGNG